MTDKIQSIVDQYQPRGANKMADCKTTDAKDPAIIANPFNTIYDVTDQTPIETVPPEYWQQKQKIKDEKEELEKTKLALESFSKNPDIEELLFDEIHRTVSKFDDHVVRSVFYVGLSAYSEPLNLALKAESGLGKTYSTVETLKLFPEEDVQFIGSQSPKVLTHLNGIRKTKDGKELKDEDEPEKPDASLKKTDYDKWEALTSIYREKKAQWDEDIKNSYYEVPLSGKIYAFLENFNQETFKMFKATMSHDHPYIDHPWVDDKGRVHKTRLVGWPVVIRNAVDVEYNAEQATRDLTVSPCDKTEKIEDAMEIANRIRAYPWLYQVDSFNRKIIKEYLRKIRDYIRQGKIGVLVPFIGIKEGFSREATRDMRDFNKFLDLVPAVAIFRLFQRPIVMIGGKRYLIPTVQDAIKAKEVYDAILNTTKTNTDQRILDFYNTVVAKTKGLAAEDLADIYNKDRKKKLTVRRIREWLRRLDELGWVDIREATERNEKGYVDRRFNAYYPLKNAANAAILDIAVDLESILKTGFENWLKNVTMQADNPIIILNIDGTAKAIDDVEFRNLIINSGGPPSNNVIFSNPESVSVDEKKPESAAISEIAVNAAFSKTLYYEKIPRNPGVHCSAADSGGYECTFEAEYDLNSNLYCEAHFKEQVKTCEDNGFPVRPKVKEGA